MSRYGCYEIPSSAIAERFAAKWVEADKAHAREFLRQWREAGSPDIGWHDDLGAVQHAATSESA